MFLSAQYDYIPVVRYFLPSRYNARPDVDLACPSRRQQDERLDCLAPVGASQLARCVEAELSDLWGGARLRC